MAFVYISNIHHQARPTNTRMVTFIQRYLFLYKHCINEYTYLYTNVEYIYHIFDDIKFLNFKIEVPLTITNCNHFTIRNYWKLLILSKICWRLPKSIETLSFCNWRLSKSIKFLPVYYWSFMSVNPTPL